MKSRGNNDASGPTVRLTAPIVVVSLSVIVFSSKDADGDPVVDHAADVSFSMLKAASALKSPGAAGAAPSTTVIPTWLAALQLPTLSLPRTFTV